MQSVLSRSALSRRVASAAVVGLAATTLSLGVAGTAHADTTVTDLKGTVTGVGGAAVAGIEVNVYNAATNSFLADEVTGVDGKYQFDDLEFNGNVKIAFQDNNGFDLSTTRFYLPRWYGDSRYRSGAASVTLVQDVASTVNINLPSAAIIAGSVAAASDGHALNNFGVDLADADDSLDWNGYVAYNEDSSHFRIAVEPGAYRVGGYGQDNPPSGTVSYLETWWRNADTMSAATPINVTFGQIATGIDIRVTNALTARQAPAIVGIPAVGRPLTATPGRWSRNAGTEFSYTWMRGTTVVGTGQTYVPSAADFGQRLNVVVRALNFDAAGQAASAQTDVVRYPADAKGKAKAQSGRKVRFGVKIVSAKQSPVKGKVVVMRGTKVVHKAVKLVKGKAVIVVKHQPKGKQTYTVLYKGNSTLSIATKTFTVRVHS